MSKERQNSDGMNPKRERFCIEYTKDLNGKQAAIRAGYSPKTAEVQAAQLLSILKVRNRIAELQKDFQRDAHMTVAQIRQKIEALADAAERDADKLKALDLLVRIEGMIIDRSKVEHSGDGFVLNIVSAKEVKNGK